MGKETENVRAAPEAIALETRRPGWPAPLLIGLVMGTVTAIVAAFLRRQPVIKGQATPRPAAPASALPSAAGDARPVSTLPVPQAHPPAASQPAPGSQPEKPGPPPPAPSSRWREPTKYVVGVGLFLAVLAVLWISRSVIPTVIVAALLAMVVQPVLGFLQRRLKLNQGLSIAITYLSIVALIVLIPLFVVPNLIQTLNDLINVDFHALAEILSSTLEGLSAQVSQIPVLNGLLTPLLESVIAALQGIPPPGASEPVTYEETMGTIVDQLAGTLGFIANILGPIISAVVTVVFMLLISFHLSLSGRRMLEGYPRLIPPAYRQEITDLVNRIEGVWLSFLRGQFALMVIVGVIVWLGNALLGNRNALLLGFISGMMEIIPNLGPALALIPGVGMALLFGSSHFAISPPAFAIIVLIFYLLVQVVENQLIVPYVLGGELQVSPLVVIIGIMVGGSVAGILGVLLAVPIIATGREIFMYLYEKILELPEPDEPPEEKPSLLDAVRDRLRRVKLPFGQRHEQVPTPKQ